jgi:REP element-mobilizing transposase RayT
MAFRIARQERPFTIEAIVILPDRLHTIWTLPSSDSDFSGRWRRIKAYFTHRLVAGRLGGRCRRIHDGFRRAEGLIPDFAALHPGYDAFRRTARRP